MKRFLKVSLVVVLAVMISVPALAEYSVDGFYRAKGEFQNFALAAGRTSDFNDDSSSHMFTEQRARFKNTFSNNEFAKAIFYIETDQIWGDSATTVGRNQGAAIGADSINIELKNLYTWFKIPDTDWEFTVGLRGMRDPYKFVLYLNDMAGIVAKTKFESVGLHFGWIKGFENDRNEADDYDMTFVEASFKATENLNLGVNVHWFNDDRNRDGGSTDDVYTVGVNGALKINDIVLDGFVLYQFGTVNVPAGTDLDHAAYAANLKASVKLGPGNAFIEGLYISGDDDPLDNDIESLTPLAGGNGPFYISPQMYIITYNAEQHTNAQSPFALDTNGNAGNGLMLIAAGYKQAVTDTITGKIGVGYAADVEKDAVANDERNAIEINA
ncbi:MAG: hypothetical protein OEM19_04700, partial [Deltaproteobacteria bacterium]|nr:hypothetical protein [Deltaproteobacteria bacterium]